MQPLLSASLSLVPGVGHWILGHRKKAAALFVCDCGIMVTLFFLRSNTGRYLAGFSYLLIMIPAVIETYTLAQGGANQVTESKPYILTLLLLMGFSALPLLWHSNIISKRNKIIGSIVVSVFALAFWGFLGVYGIQLYSYFITQFG